MARTPSRFVIPLGDEEREILGYLKDDGETPRIRHRAHAILLSDSGKSVNEIAEIFETTRVTVCSWLVRWEDWGPQGLADNPRTGAPPKLTNSEKKKVVRLINKYPHSPKQVLNEIPSQRSKQLNTLGFLRYDNQLTSYTVEGTIDSETVIGCFDDFSNSLRRTTTVVIDNAPVHTSKEFESRIPIWEKKGLFLYFLPSYCPELNLIEIFWSGAYRRGWSARWPLGRNRLERRPWWRHQG